MQFYVIRLCHNLEIFNTIIEFVSVFVMDDFTASERASEMLFHHDAMLKLSLLPSDTHIFVPAKENVPALPCGVFITRLIYSSSDFYTSYASALFTTKSIPGITAFKSLCLATALLTIEESKLY